MSATSSSALFHPTPTTVRLKISLFGPKSLYMGLTPALTRYVLYGGLRLGLYEPSKYACDWAFGSTNIFFKIASDGFAGSFATALTNPIVVLKGLGPNMAKATALTASQLATYDESKRILVRWTRFEEGFNLHLLALIQGLTKIVKIKLMKLVSTWLCQFSCIQSKFYNSKKKLFKCRTIYHDIKINDYF
ncbi:hypothetical protein UlMin_010650 [Ulmus minor]